MLLRRWQPGDPRPDPFNAAGGGLDLEAVSGSIPAPAPDVLAKEREAFRHLAAATPAPDMEVPLALLHGLCAVQASLQGQRLPSLLRSLTKMPPASWLPHTA